ncbi:hypothetical protein SEA_FOSTEROUS_51 [Gordonia phage Fosterous]|uniref:HNH endonuclease n=1 Tax=Gordonia phage Fosterous TaxID=2483668 RepID=A0A3G3M9N8_9CAUD|nr:hypothetical protein KNU19_gp51 [Gordonia phage Fosterous]AYR02807.1 hypothetical protein SEA_FOSTEROUS_51 [Gordonia phage Fosterous]
MTADPAIAAAQRAMSNPEVEAAWIDGGNDLAIAAAREALAPLRKLHRPTRSNEWQHAKTKCPAGHDYAGDNLIVVQRPNRAGPERRCRTCTRATERRSRARKTGV